MQIKEVSPMHFLYFRTRTTLAGLAAFVGQVVGKLYRDAATQDLFVSGPAYWCYFNFEAVDKPFDLEICLPIASLPTAYTGEFNVKTTAQFRCLSHVHEGRWEKFSETYSLMMEIMRKQKLTPANENRELYINIDFMHGERNVTEIQVGINEPMSQ